jgi:hypothetical protein
VQFLPNQIFGAPALLSIQFPLLHLPAEFSKSFDRALVCRVGRFGVDD